MIMQNFIAVIHKAQTLFSQEDMMIFAVVLLAVTILPIILRAFGKRKSVAAVTAIVFVIYIIGNLSFTIFNRETQSVASVYLTPGRDFRIAFRFDLGIRGTLEALLHGQWGKAFASMHVADASMAREVLLNILLYLPLGYLLPFLSKTLRGHIVLITLIGFLCSCATEFSQYYFRIGVFEVDDMILNTLGTLIGAIIGSVLAAAWRVD